MARLYFGSRSKRCGSKSTCGAMYLCGVVVNSLLDRLAHGIRLMGASTVVRECVDHGSRHVRATCFVRAEVNLVSGKPLKHISLALLQSHYLQHRLPPRAPRPSGSSLD